MCYHIAHACMHTCTIFFFLCTHTQHPHTPVQMHGQAAFKASLLTLQLSIDINHSYLTADALYSLF